MLVAGKKGLSVSKTLIVAVLVVGVLAAGCGDDDDESPEAVWAGDICGSVLEWRDSVTAVVNDLGVDDVAAVVTGGVDAIAQRLEPIAEATTQLGDDLRDIDLPESEQTEAARDEIESIQEQVDQLSTLVTDDVSDLSDSDDLVGDATTLVSNAVSAIDALVTSVQTLDELDVAGELRSGFEEAPECQELRDET